ncbi:S-layer homology domain-containing protein [Paenibacillus camelliae]|uniref:S-layer homology domain-containing protein n=1 Tax=Paenibacillus camelliae TaxID=512410 RepID=UPI00203C1DCA|nr:S-layer homology domain-containing protein [Paenibacillus camelliae]MCM3634758.1 S-layer homology domain-containing protein [Paenibacillus camelliae]
MKKITSLICLSFIIMIITATAVGASASARTDFKGHWAENTILKWLDEEYIYGYSDGTFRPQATITRAEFVTIVNRVFNIQVKTPDQKMSFRDLPSTHWAYYPMMTAVYKGYVSGTSKEKISPSATITRQEAIVMLVRLLEVTGDGKLSYSDNNKIASWSRSSFGALAANGITFEDEKGQVRPIDKLTRAETVAIVDRLKTSLPLPAHLSNNEKEEDITLAIEGYGKLQLLKNQVRSEKNYGVKGFHEDHSDYYVIIPQRFANKDVTLKIQLSSKLQDKTLIASAPLEEAAVTISSMINEDGKHELGSPEYAQHFSNDKGVITLTFNASQDHIVRIDGRFINLTVEPIFQDGFKIKKENDRLFLNNPLLQNGDMVYYSIPSSSTTNGYSWSNSVYYYDNDYKLGSILSEDRIYLLNDLKPKGKLNVEVVRKGKTIYLGDVPYDLNEATTKVLNERDYTISYVNKEELNEFNGVSYRHYYQYSIDMDDYIKKHYPTARFYETTSRLGNDRSIGFTKEDQKWTIDNEEDISKKLPVSLTSYDYEYGNSRDEISIHAEAEHYITLYDSNRKLIETLQIYIDIPQQHLGDGISKKGNIDIDKLIATKAKLNNVTSNVNFTWSYGTYKPQYYDVYEENKQYPIQVLTKFKPDLNYYEFYFEPNAEDTKEPLIINYDVLNGMNVNVDIEYRKHGKFVKRDREKEQGIVVELDKDHVVDIRMIVKNPYNDTESIYQFVIKPKRSLQQELSFSPYDMSINQLLPGDQVTLNIPSSLTLTGKQVNKMITIKKYQQSYFLSDDEKTILKTNVKGNIKVKVTRGKGVVYEGNYNYNSTPLKMFDGANYKIPITQYDSEQLKKERGVIGSTIFYAGKVDLSSIPNARFAIALYNYDYPSTYEAFNSYRMTYDNIDDVKYESGVVVFFKGDEKYKLEQHQKLYFVVFDKDLYPIGVVKVNLKLTEKYIHPRAVFK